VAAVRRAARPLIALPFVLFFAVPLLAMVDFSTRKLGGGRTLDAWEALVQDPFLRTSIVNSLMLAGTTVVLMLLLLVPTMIWVRLRVPRAARIIEFLCLLPLTVPPLVIVVGISGVYAWVTYFFGNSSLTLTFVYVVLVLPFAFRAVDASLSALNAEVLAEAARSLGASWFTVIARVIVPNIWSGVLAAAFISVALVLGEYTFASLLNFETLPVAITLAGKRDAAVSTAASLAALIVAFLLLFLLSLVGRRSRRLREGN
jgi:putative spermidine/putrescine transport system permease protein